MSIKIFTDQLGNQVSIPYPPKRIISVVPSQTELLFHLGLDEEIIGITKFCIHPSEQFKSKTKIGGTKQLNLELIQSLKPDLIIANKEENAQTQIEALQTQFPVWISDIKTCAHAIDMIHKIGEITNTTDYSKKLGVQLSQNFDKLAKNINVVQPKKVAYFIWRKPYMVAAKDTFIDDILKRGGFENCFSNKNRYPEIEIADLQNAKPNVIFLSSEPYPFKEKHIEELKIACPNAMVKLVDGELFSWYGNRLLKTANYLQQLQQELT